VNESVTLPAPVLPITPGSKWRCEQQAFRKMLPDLLKTHRNQFVAIHEGALIASGDDKLAVAQAAYAQFGYVPIFVSLVSDEPQAVVRMPSPRQTYFLEPT
jgi:hypothetical protein